MYIYKPQISALFRFGLIFDVLITLPMINFYFDVENSSIFCEFKLSTFLQLSFNVLYTISRNLRAKTILAGAPLRGFLSTHERRWEIIKNSEKNQE